MSEYSIAIAGATGLVGTTLLSLLIERNFPIKNLFLLASPQSAGKQVAFKNKSISLQDLNTFDFSQTQITFFCVSAELAAIYIPKSIAANNIVIDKSNLYRNHPDVPLVIPEVNIELLNNIQKNAIIASPNCNTIPIAVALKPIYDAAGISRINIATYQSVSGTGKDAVSELLEQSSQYLNNQTIKSQIYPQQIAFNVLPHIDDFEENGYTKEEMKIINEMKKIFNDSTLLINPTTVRVPVICGHAAAVHLETKRKISSQEATDLLNQHPGIKVVTGKYPYPTPVHDAAGNDQVYIGRIREDISHPNGLNLWVVADNLRKGAALNAIQIAEHLINQ